MSQKKAKGKKKKSDKGVLMAGVYMSNVPDGSDTVAFHVEGAMEEGGDETTPLRTLALALLLEMGEEDAVALVREIAKMRKDHQIHSTH